MAIWMAMMLAAGLAPEDGELSRRDPVDEDWTSVDGVLLPRLGAWGGRSFHFDAIRTDGLEVTSKQEAFFSTSALAGLQFYDHFVVLGTFEADVASKLTVQAGGAYVGWREHPQPSYGQGVPDEVMVYAGALEGKLEVSKTGFGAFERGVGFAGGLQVGWTLARHVTFDLFAEYRYLKFDYEVAVTSGNKSIGGSSGWIGFGLDLRF